MDESTEHPYSFIVEQKNGLELTIVTSFNNSYLMGDTRNEFFSEIITEPYFIVYDEDGCSYDSEELVGKFDCEIISWEYPTPVENTFVFAGFSEIYDVSLVVMLLFGALTLIVCWLFVKKDKDIKYRALDIIGIILNFAVAFVVFPFLTFAMLLIQAFPTGPDWIYQADLCVPAVIIFSLAASISLSRCF